MRHQNMLHCHCKSMIIKSLSSGVMLPRETSLRTTFKIKCINKTVKYVHVPTESLGLQRIIQPLKWLVFCKTPNVSNFGNESRYKTLHSIFNLHEVHHPKCPSFKSNKVTIPKIPNLIKSHPLVILHIHDCIQFLWIIYLHSSLHSLICIFLLI